MGPLAPCASLLFCTCPAAAGPSLTSSSLQIFPLLAGMIKPSRFTSPASLPACLPCCGPIGITWVLSEEVYGMSEGQWLEWCGRLADAPRPLQRGSELWEWLQHQRGLHALGWLPLRRIRALAPLQVGCGTTYCTAAVMYFRRSTLCAPVGKIGGVPVRLRGCDALTAAPFVWWLCGGVLAFCLPKHPHIPTLLLPLCRYG